MKNIDQLKAAISELYENNTEIHIDVHSAKPKINVSGAKATITGVYKNLFRIEVMEEDIKKSFTVQYADLFIGKIKIHELEKAV